MHQVFCNPDILSIIIEYFQDTKVIILVCKTFYNTYLKYREYRSNQVKFWRDGLDKKQDRERLEIYVQIARFGHSLRDYEYQDYVSIVFPQRPDLYSLGPCSELMEIYYKNRNIYGMPSPTERNLVLFKNIYQTGPYLDILINLLANKFDREIYLFVKQEIDDSYFENTDDYRHFDNILHHIEVENIDCFIDYIEKRLKVKIHWMEWGYLRDKMIQIMASASIRLDKKSMKKLVKTNQKILNCKTYK